jgi:Pyruvate/2-oxoacid:ferredoxin oxidoreductase delta subunit
VTDIDRWKCILCFACVKFCPEQAKSLPVTDFHAAIDKMAEANAARKEPVTFLAGG